MHSYMDVVAIIVAGLAGFAVGGVWFHDKVFGGRWMKETGITPENGAGKGAVIRAIISSIISAFGLFYLIDWLGIDGFMGGLHLGIFLGVLIFMAGSYANYAFNKRSNFIYFAETGYVTLNFTVACIILTTWPW